MKRIILEKNNFNIFNLRYYICRNDCYYVMKNTRIDQHFYLNIKGDINSIGLGIEKNIR